ncbi:chalcone isomerase family protein [Amphritea japonica]|nr:chalcone isomerase family protein [Amphritea japonica]
MRLNLLFFVLMIFAAGALHAKPEHLPVTMKTVGQAELKLLWFSLYTATLASPEGRFISVSGPLLLTLKYKRKISRQNLLDETEKQWDRAGIDVDSYAPWLLRLKEIWPDISQGDSLAFFQTAEGEGRFYYNQQHIGTLSDRKFSKAFLNIWLSDNSYFPQLTKALTGRTGD